MNYNSIFNERDGLRFILEKKFNERKSNEFPNDDINYVNVYKQIEDHLNAQIHPETEKGAILNGSGLLTDHGASHVSMVIQRAGLLLNDNINKLSGFEIFIFLLAAHFHDVGNILGREKHEEKIMDIMQKVEVLTNLQTPVKLTICNIATAHGGTYNDTHDTIASLLPSDYVEGIEIRPAVLASLLRYADEISDDHTRAARFLYDIGEIPPGNKVYHDYSKTLEPITVNGNAVICKFNIPYDLAVNKTTKNDKHGNCVDVFLYDEILSRLEKMVCELEYCGKYSQGFILVNSVEVKISVQNPNSIRPIFETSMRLRLFGYPELCNYNISKLCEDQLEIEKGDDLKNVILSQGKENHE
jgi:hypothetical protein